MRFLFGLCLLLCSTASMAEQLTGRQLYEWLNSSDEKLAMAANMYIAGVMDDDTLLQAGAIKGMYQANNGKDIRHICLPAGTTIGGLKAPVLELLEKYPNLRAQPAIATVRVALAKAFPCSS
ncbi:Rap1a/Tai family immunity protein [Chitinasiproducens palmae]|uniref:Rap1a immunity protein domain-containing protein n=1 Tax=Chitinasiproducens palmae TaxID=1770053 RepID=A0A1H2PQP3_9BURK|nr:Rap1a/Tai family immunity protein [Chitinasiproducens palmae]SDV49162.1 hypothetical protein SAMN05216551_107117 [Chitinasiproducens palmae]